MLGCFHYFLRRIWTDIFDQYSFTQLLSALITTLTAQGVRKYGNLCFIKLSTRTQALRQYILSSVYFLFFFTEVRKRNTFQEISSLLPAVMCQWISDFISVGYVLCIMQFSIAVLLWLQPLPNTHSAWKNVNTTESSLHDHSCPREGTTATQLFKSLDLNIEIAAAAHKCCIP